MKKIDIKILKITLFCLLSGFPIGIAKAQWALPDVAGLNLPADFDDAVLNMTDWFLGFVGSMAVLYLVWGAIKYTSSSGDQQKTTEAKAVIKYALMGLVVAGISYALVVVFVTRILL